MLFRIIVPDCFQFRMIGDLKSFLKNKGGDMHYIGGNEILPPPFDANEESIWIEKLQKDESRSEAISVLVEHNLRLVVYIAKKFDNTGD